MIGARSGTETFGLGHEGTAAEGMDQQRAIEMGPWLATTHGSLQRTWRCLP